MVFEADSAEYDGIAVATICGEVDVVTAARLRRRLKDLLDSRPNRLIVSLEFVDFPDAAGVTALDEMGGRAAPTEPTSC